MDEGGNKADDNEGDHGGGKDFDGSGPVTKNAGGTCPQGIADPGGQKRQYQHVHKVHSVTGLGEGENNVFIEHTLLAGNASEHQGEAKGR